MPGVENRVAAFEKKPFEAVRMSQLQTDKWYVENWLDRLRRTTSSHTDQYVDAEESGSGDAVTAQGDAGDSGTKQRAASAAADAGASTSAGANMPKAAPTATPAPNSKRSTSKVWAMTAAFLVLMVMVLLVGSAYRSPGR